MINQFIKNNIKNIYYRILLKKYQRKQFYAYDSFDFKRFNEHIISYVKNMQWKSFYEYKFSGLQEQADLYSSVYAAMIFGLFGEIKKMSVNEKKQWADYLLSHQREDGLFRDDKLNSPKSETYHYWGWHHLAPHMLIALDYLDSKPYYDFQIILNLFKKQSMDYWLENRDWKGNYLAVSNEIMNVGLLLQCSRELFSNELSGQLVQEMKLWLITNQRDPKTTLWGHDTRTSIFNISKAIKTAYHIIPIFYFDKEENLLEVDRILRYTLQTQNPIFGFSPFIISDACEDVDSTYLLSIFYSNNEILDKNVVQALRKYFDWVFMNMNNDCGFVFRRFQPFQYADQPLLSSKKNQSNMFGTWFRTLSIAFACTRLNIKHQFQFSKVPGYQFYRE